MEVLDGQEHRSIDGDALMIEVASFERAGVASAGAVRIQHWINVFLLLFIAFSFLVPWIALSRAFLFAGVLPLVLWAGVQRKAVAINDRSGWFAVGFVGFVAVATFAPEGLSSESKYQVVRWAVSTVVFMLAVLAASEKWLDKPRLFARILMGVVVVGGVVALLFYLWTGQYPARLRGFGFMGHPILGPSALISVWAVGLILYWVSETRERVDQIIIAVSFLILFAVVVLSQSRGPLAALLGFLVFFLLSVYWRNERIKSWRMGCWLVLGVLFFAGFTVFLFDDFLARMLARGFSFRPQIWLAVVENPPEMIFFGEGMASEFVNTGAGRALFEQTGKDLKHPHNLFLSVYHYAGIIGASLLFALLTWVLVRVFRLSSGAGRRLRPFAFSLLVLTLLLNMTDGHRIVAPPSTDWMFFWLPLMFLIGLARHFERQSI